MKIISLFLSMFVLLLTARSQNCEGFFPVKEGTVIEMQSFNPKDKLQAISRQTILSVNSLAEGLAIKVKSEQFDDKNKPVFDQELEMRCIGDVFYMDMKNFLDPKTMSGFKDMEVTVSGADLEFPGVMQVGQTLKDGDIKMAVNSSGMNIMNLEVKIYNRKVEAIESITTPAGTFECYKVSYDTEFRTMFKITAKGTEWISRNVGTVKSEQYDKNGKLTGYTLLTKFGK